MKPAHLLCGPVKIMLEVVLQGAGFSPLNSGARGYVISPLNGVVRGSL